MKNLFPALFLLISLPALAAEEGHLMIHNGHIRAMPPTVRNTAAYFTFHNHTDHAVTLTGAHTAVAAKVELHETVNMDGQLLMRAMNPVTVPAMGELILENGGRHLMVMDLEAPLAPGDEVIMVLDFADGSELAVTLPVKTPMAADQPDNTHNHMHH